MAKNKVVSKTRRGNNEGSVYQRKDGRWCGYISIGFDENGKPRRKTIYGKNQSEVAKKLTEISGRFNSQNYDIIENKYFSDLLFEWLMVFKKSAITPRSFEGNLRNFNLHIKPFTSKLKLYEVDTVVVQKIFNTMLENGYSLATVKKCKFILNQFFEYAIDSKWANNNPTMRIKLRAKDRKTYTANEKYKALTPEIRDLFLEALNRDESNFIKPICITMMFAGLRIGEALAITWKNVDFENKTLTVEQGVTTIPRFNDKGEIIDRVTVVSDTKTACSVREIPVTDIVITTLKEWKQKQRGRGYVVGKDLTRPSMYVFANDDETVRTYSGTRMIYDRFKTRNKLMKYGITFHSLRHTFSNMLFEMNENPKVIQQLLGHRDVKTTITVYNSVNNEYVRETTDKLNERIKSMNLGQKTTLQPKESVVEITKPKTEMTNEELDAMLEKLQKEKELREQKERERLLAEKNAQASREKDLADFEEFMKWKALKRQQQEDSEM